METSQATNVSPSEEIWAILRRTAEIGEKNKEELDKLVNGIIELREDNKEIREIQKETARQMKDTDRQMKETDRQMKETDRQMKETDRKMKETDRKMKETDRKMDEYNKRFGDFINRFGEVVEYMIAPGIRDKFQELGIIFSKANSGTRVSDQVNNIHFEIDVMLENGNTALAVEIKTKLSKWDVNGHIGRLKKMRIYADLHGDKRVFLGAVAGVVMTAHVKEYALEQGLYVIEPSGDSFFITPPKDKPKEW